ncbi:DUF4294 domain-containing protein [Flavobacterium sp. MK4S-17]|uniref:DUF4294 domain-containing protein n=1 Tax=Flavobacterium sp. MK4S-17 TaxID=2543737 RepID=UPI001F2BD5FE|nr:DUF4294 domain-containing protein [Flavobacterium sp. MK4S-17]
MKTRVYLIFILLASLSSRAQVITDTIKNGMENDSIVFNIEMEEIVISNVKSTLSEEERKKLLILRRRVLKVYPYAKIAAERLTVLNANMAKLKTEREKKKYSKIVEKYLETEFEDQLKKLSRKDGQILVKLIYRQTGQSTFDLIKEHKSGWKAFWANRMAKLFSINIKEKYNPATVPEDYYIEGFLLQAFAERRLIRQEPAFEIDYAAITQKWMDKQ